ncbi:DUF5906 domain-containing protein [Acidovorax sp. NPDC077693]|uniref:DUF5906 domain-containing protein n=1 Tax=unclassified Acidovorax TaxID=2684926 RepID=UPI0037C5688C
MGNPNTKDIDLLADELVTNNLGQEGAESMESNSATNDEEFDVELMSDGDGLDGEQEGADSSLTSQQIVEDLLKKSEADCGAPFEEVALHALLGLRDRNYPEWMRVRAQLKRANKDISIVKLDQAIGRLGTSLKEVAPTHFGYAKDIWDKLSVDGYAPVTVNGVLYLPQASTQLWVELPFNELKAKIARVHDGKVNCFREEDYHSIAKVVLTLRDQSSFFEDAPEGVACLRSFHSVRDRKICQEVLGLKHRQQRSLPFEPEDVPTPLYDAFRAETFYSTNEGEEQEQISLLDEFAGASMLGIGHRFQKAFVWMDRYGRAGKGAMQEILGRLVHPDLTSAISPLDWGGGNRYFIASLADMRLNVVGELPENAAIPSAEFKSVLGGDLLTGRLPTQPPFSFRNRAMHLFMTNHAIKVNEHSEAFYARWKLMEFPNSRLKSGQPLDPSLALRIANAEISGIAYKALKGAERLLSQGKFSESKVHDRLMHEWRVSANSLQEFIQENCELGGDKLLVRQTSFYENYRAWCKENGRIEYANARVKDMLTHSLKLSIRAAVLDGHKIYRGLRFKPQPLAEFDVNLEREDELRDVDASMNGGLASDQRDADF